jgi:phenylacetate-coenzyme A ligase PaaK-like adenylate-forming protein
MEIPERVNQMLLTPLESWIKDKIGLQAAEPLTRRALEAYQLGKLRETITHARQNSPFYKERLAGYGEPESLGDLTRFPFTFPAQIRDDDLRFLCVSRGEIERVVTLPSSGTTASSKRLHFTTDDLELTIDFFHHGMSTLVEPGDRVLILMPGELPGSVGDLLVKGLSRMEVEGIVRWPVGEADDLLEFMVSGRVTSLVGLPGQVLQAVRHPKAPLLPKGQIRSVLLSADYVPDAVVREIRSAWDCPVFNHYGMTEMGLGGGVDCRALAGYHLREADLYFEIVNPIDGRPVPDGETGEVVFTTLTRTGMPLIRYRTGDLARFVTGPCPCGTILRRLGHVRGRIEAMVEIGDGLKLDSSDLSETLYAVPGLVDYRAELVSEEGRDLLSLTLRLCYTEKEQTIEKVKGALMEVPSIMGAVASGHLSLGTIKFEESGPIPTGVAKKTITDSRKKGMKS